MQTWLQGTAKCQTTGIQGDEVEQVWLVNLGESLGTWKLPEFDRTTLSHFKAFRLSILRHKHGVLIMAICAV